MKRLICLIASLVMILPFVKIDDTDGVNFPYKEPLSSESAVLISLDTDSIIHERNADIAQCPGPLVNIMTAVIVLENCKDLNQELTLDPDIYTHIYDELDDPEDLPMVEISDNDVLTVSDLLYCMMLTSSVEAAEMLAHHVGKLIQSASENKGGDPVAVFVEKMNEKAAEIGMRSTKFMNAHGMHDPQQYTTARDMATLTKYALDVPLFQEIATAYSYNPTVPNIKRHPNHEKWVWTHSNVMMDDKDTFYYYLGAKGIKTAKLETAGRNIVTIASKNGYNYLVVLMKAPFKDADGNVEFYHIKDAMQLLDWAFDHFSRQEVLASTAELGERPVKLADNDGKNYVLARPKESVELLWCDEIEVNLINHDKIIWYKENLMAPIDKDEVLGEVTLEYSGEELAKVELVAVSGVKRSKSKYNLEVAKRFTKSEWFRTAIKITIILSIIYIIICIYAMVLFKSNKKPLKPMYAVPKVDKKKKKKRPSADRENRQ